MPPLLNFVDFRLPRRTAHQPHGPETSSWWTNLRTETVQERHLETRLMDGRDKSPRTKILLLFFLTKKYPDNSSIYTSRVSGDRLCLILNLITFTTDDIVTVVIIYYITVTKRL